MTHHDIRGELNVEEALKQSEERYHDLLENANDLIQSVDQMGSFLYVNRAWKETMGYSDDEIARLKVFDVISPACREHCSLLFQEILSGRAVPRVDVQFSAKNGKLVELEGSINASSVDGKPLVTRGIFRNVTERKAMERELRESEGRHRELLERKVEEKTRHLREAQAKLIQSEKMTSLGEVISGVAHELNNPLAGILGAIQMLRGSALAQPTGAELMEGVEVLEDIEKAALRCQNIVENLIRFSTQARCNFSEMDVNQLLRDTLDIMAEQLAEAGITVQWHSDPALPAIEGDFVKLLEVFVNLLRNAESALSGGGTLEIFTCQPQNDPVHPQVQIKVRDNGCGIPAQHLGKIFDPFFTTRPVGKGPGLGLTVSYGIIKRHGGDIDVHSAPGRGTTITVTLPVRQPERQEPLGALEEPCP